MANNWPLYKVMDLQERGVLLVEDGNHGEYRPRAQEFGSGDYAFIRAADMDGGRVLFASAERVNATAMARIRKGIGKGGDVLFSHKGTVGKMAFAPLDAPLFVCSPQTTFWRTLDESVLDRRFLYFYMHASEFTDQWNARKGETDMADYVSLTAQRELSIALPPLPEQRAIAGVLGALDDKIELNRRINRTLEGMARAIFKSWFVDFDPVRAKAAGKPPPGLKPALANLFPDRFEDSELGEIPKGWKVGTVGKLCEFAYGKALKAEDRVPGLFPVMGSNGQVGTHNESLVKGPGVVVGRKGNPGIVTWVNADFFPIDTTFYVVPLDKECPLSYLAAGLERLDLAHLGADSAVPGLNRNIAYGSKIVRPDTAALTRFDEFMLTVRRRQDAAERQSCTLAALRDTLLPKLISGELRVPDAERIAARAV